MAPKDCGDELEERDYVEWSSLRTGWFAIEEEVEELEADWVPLDI